MFKNKKSKGYVKGFKPYNKSTNKHPQYHGDPNFLLNACHGTGSPGWTILFSLLLLSCAVPAISNCTPPQGSYQGTCNVTGALYVSTDPNLKSIQMCKFDLHCKDLKDVYRHTPVYVQKSMSGCLKFFENCGGNPVLRETNTRECTEEETIKRQSKTKMEL